eukprot:5214336-Ditylum_brightwellii.AAC.2
MCGEGKHVGMLQGNSLGFVVVCDKGCWVAVLLCTYGDPNLPVLSWVAVRGELSGLMSSANSEASGTKGLFYR